MTFPPLRISVIGCGYLGVTHAASMAELGFEVIGVEVSPGRLEGLREGRIPHYEPGLQPLLTRQIEEGRLSFTDSIEAAAEFANVHFICVGTPQSADGLAADTSAVFETAKRIAAIATEQILIVGKSTVPVGTAAELQRELSAMGADHHVTLAWNPEFLREGHAVEDTLSPDRLVFGVRSKWGEDRLRDVYASLINDGVPVVVTDFETAELAKVAANAFLATKVSFINAIADLCQETGADVVELADALGHDVRIGRRYLHAGVGFGGGCLPKDIRALRHRAGDFDVQSLQSLLSVVEEINDDRHEQVVDRARQLVSSERSKITVLGAAFKPHTDDVRDSPSLWVARTLAAQGLEVSIYDPRVPTPAEPDGLRWADTIEDASRGCELLVHLTDWPEFREIDPHDLKRYVDAPVMLDARNLLDRKLWRGAGWDVHSMGRP